MHNKTGNGHNVDVDTFLEDVKTVVRDGQDLLKAGLGGVKEKALAGARTTDRAIRRQPYKAMALIFGLGLMTGLMAASAFSRGEEAED